MTLVFQFTHLSEKNRISMQRIPFFSQSRVVLRAAIISDKGSRRLKLQDVCNPLWTIDRNERQYETDRESSLTRRVN